MLITGKIREWEDKRIYSLTLPLKLDSLRVAAILPQGEIS